MNGSYPQIVRLSTSFVQVGSKTFTGFHGTNWHYLLRQSKVHQITTERGGRR